MAPGVRLNAYARAARGPVVRIPAGNVRVAGRDVSISAFDMGETPVIQRQFGLFMQYGASRPYGSLKFDPTGRIIDVAFAPTVETVASAIVLQSQGDAFGDAVWSTPRRLVPDAQKFVERFAHTTHKDVFLAPEAPVTKVEWYEAAAFAFSVGARLPHELEWQYAAQGGDLDAAFATGGTQAGQLARANASWNREAVEAVAQYAPNGYRLHDMTGLVWEWMANGWAQGIATLIESPMGALFPLEQVRSLRGGSWNDNHPDNFRLACRYDYGGPTSRSPYIGFRLAVAAQDSIG